MKNYLKLFLAINLVSASNTFTQDLINPYQNFLGTLAAQLNNPILNCKYQYPPQTNYNAPNPEGMLFSPAARTVLQSSGYDGEYQIILSDFPWLYDKGPIVIPIPLFASLAKTYTIEAASFPFTTPCWDQPSSCVYPAYGSLAERHFFMPDDQYNATTKKWNILTNSVSDNFIGSPLYITAPTTLVSMRYVTDEVNSFTSPFIPHTIIKHTIYLHCTSSPTSDIINQFTFYYDNTRGALRYYPFKVDNYTTSGNAGVWDILFRPEVVTDIRDKIGAYVCDYSQVSNADWFDGGTIDYFPFQYSNHICANNPLPSSQFVSTYDASPLNGEEFRARSHNFVFPAPYSLISCHAKNHSGQYPAGYTSSANVLQYYANANLGVKHTYHIDQNIDLTIINPSEQTIYNPSEVDVTASDLHFPSYYTFKTIRGVYPSIANVTADNNDPQTGGPYADPRDVPVRTDLRSENANDPQDPNTPWHSVYSSRYYLKNGSKLTIEPCVNIFDATFDVEEGATLVFENQQYNLGFEHKKLNQTQNLGRYKIKGKGGAILRNYNHTQYVQNGKIKQPYNLHYIATSTILSGATVAVNVDDDDQLPGNYSIEPGGDVQFTAPDLISLRDGFSAKTGCTFKAKCADPGLLQQCPQQVNGNGGNKMAPQFTQQNKTNASSGIIIPNPSNGIFTYRTINFSPENTASIEVINSMGIKLISKMIDDENTNFDITQYGKGVYYLRAMNGKNVRVEKVVVK